MAPDEIRETVRRRAGVAADLFGWSHERVKGFLDELVRQDHVPKRELAWLDPSPFGIDEEFVISPGPEKTMSAEERRAIGRYDAASAFASWDIDPPEGPDREDMDTLARMYCDKSDLEELSFVADMDPSPF